MWYCTYPNLYGTGTYLPLLCFLFRDYVYFWLRLPKRNNVGTSTYHTYCTYPMLYGTLGMVPIPTLTDMVQVPTSNYFVFYHGIMCLFDFLYSFCLFGIICNPFWCKFIEYTLVLDPKTTFLHFFRSFWAPPLCRSLTFFLKISWVFGVTPERSNF